MSIFTKQHYEAIAECLSDSIMDDNAQTHNIVQGLSELFANDNPKFDEKKFLQTIYKGSDIE